MAGGPRSGSPLVVPGDAATNSRLHLQFSFDRVKTGMDSIRLGGCEDIEMPPSPQPSPVAFGGGGGNNAPLPLTTTRAYAMLHLGGKEGKRSAVSESGDGDGRDPHFRDEELLLWVDRGNWFEDLTVELRQKREDGTDEGSLIGKGGVCLLPHMSARYGRKLDGGAIAVNLLRDAGDSGGGGGGGGGETIIAAGRTNVRVEFLEAGTLTVQVLHGKHLRDMAPPGGNMDPYVVVRAEGRASSPSASTRIATNGGTGPVFNGELLTLPIVDQHDVVIECYDHDPLRDDHDMIGSCRVSLLQAFKTGRTELWAQLQYRNEFGTTIDSGQLRCVLEFAGPRGVAFPRHRTSMIAFDDSRRFRGGAESARVSAGEGPSLPGSRSGRANGGEGKGRELLGQEVIKKFEEDGDCGFTEEEIRSSFAFVDLDKNGYIGASEIKHVLICMGELVTGTYLHRTWACKKRYLFFSP